MSEESLLAERTKQTFSARDEAERTEAARRREEWEEVESNALGGMRRMPIDKQRSRIDSAIGGVRRLSSFDAMRSLTSSPKRRRLPLSDHLVLFPSQ